MSNFFTSHHASIDDGVSGRPAADALSVPPSDSRPTASIWPATPPHRAVIFSSSSRGGFTAVPAATSRPCTVSVLGGMVGVPTVPFTVIEPSITPAVASRRLMTASRSGTDVDGSATVPVSGVTSKRALSVASQRSIVSGSSP
jgi:hypothetical protein